MWALEAANLAGILLLGAGFLWKDRRAHPLRSGGWLLLSIYWFSRTWDYLAEDDQFNALAAVLALPVFSYLAYHEMMSYSWNDEYPPLRFVTGAMFIVGLGYFVIGNVPWVSEFLIRTVAMQSVWLANMGGHHFAVGDVTWQRAELTGVPIMIVLECTAVQAYLVAGAFLFGCRGDARRRTGTFLIILPVVYLVNLIRNAIVILMVYDGGPGSFDFAHNVLGKGLSLFALIMLILVAFIRVPELYEDINGLFELPWRREPGHDYLRFVGRLYDRSGSDAGDGEGPSEE